MKSPSILSVKVLAFAVLLAAVASTQKVAAAVEDTNENRLIELRDALAKAQTDKEKIALIKQIGQTGTFLALTTAGSYLDVKPLQKAAAQAVTTIALAHKEYNGLNTRALLTKAMPLVSGSQRKAILQYLNSLPAELGFVSLFNGKDLTGWKGLVENPITRAKMSANELAAKQVGADEQMRKDWQVIDGLLTYVGNGYDNICTQKAYGDFEMYVDWKLDPNGAEPDAGIYLRGTPQVQIWDTARVNVGAQVGSGGLYNNQKYESHPSRVADNGTGQWNSFYIKMVGDKVTVLLNGIKVVDGIVLENYWDRSQPIFPIEQIELQAHGSRVYYRDIYVKEL